MTCMWLTTHLAVYLRFPLFFKKSCGCKCSTIKTQSLALNAWLCKLALFVNMVLQLLQEPALYSRSSSNQNCSKGLMRGPVNNTAPFSWTRNKEIEVSFFEDVAFTDLDAKHSTNTAIAYVAKQYFVALYPFFLSDKERQACTVIPLLWDHYRW